MCTTELLLEAWLDYITHHLSQNLRCRHHNWLTVAEATEPGISGGGRRRTRDFRGAVAGICRLGRPADH